jgi:hypothetical protein
MPKIVVNAHPRTGMSRLLNYLRVSYDRTNNESNGEYSNRDNFILWTHLPAMLLGNFDNKLLQTTIVRKPDDLIPSICDKLDSGIGLDVHDSQITYHNNNRDLFDNYFDYVNHSVNTSSLEYLSYLDNTLNNFDNLLVFSFEDVINKVERVVGKINKSFEETYKILTSKEIQHIDGVVHKKWKEEEGERLIRANRGPTNSKEQSYYVFKENFLNNKFRSELNDKYYTVLEKIENL